MELSKEYLHYYHQVNGKLDSRSELLVTLKNTEDEQFIPKRKHIGDAGFDCRARVDEEVVIDPGKRAIIPLGFGINIPLHHTGDLRPRSGLQANNGIMIGYGTIDTGYTGEVKATVFNMGDEPFVVKNGERIAQLVVLPIAVGSYAYSIVDTKHVDQLIELERGENGHGSTGVK